MKKKITSMLIAVLIMLSFNALSATVKIEIENGTKQPVTVMVGIVQGSDALPRSYNAALQLTETGTDSKKFYLSDDIDKGMTIFIYAILDKGGKTKPQEFSVNKRNFTAKMILLITKEEISENSISEIMAKFKDFSKTNSSYHEAIEIGKDEVFKSIFGSMIITNADSNVIMRIPAKSLKSDRNNYAFSGQSFSITRDFKKEALVKLNGNIPLAADMSFMLGNSEMSSFAWSVTNAGFIPWSHSEGKTQIELFYKNLDSLTLNYLADLYLKDSTIKMYFIDKIYLIESYNLKSSSFEKLTSDTEINVTVYGSGSSNYIRSNQTNLEVTKTHIVTDVWGSDLSDLLRQNAKRKLEKLEILASRATDTKSILPIYNLLQEYNPILPDLNTSNISKIKSEVLKNISEIDKSIILENNMTIE